MLIRTEDKMAALSSVCCMVTGFAVHKNKGRAAYINLLDMKVLRSVFAIKEDKE